MSSRALRALRNQLVLQGNYWYRLSMYVEELCVLALIVLVCVLASFAAQSENERALRELRVDDPFTEDLGGFARH